MHAWLNHGPAGNRGARDSCRETLSCAVALLYTVRDFSHRTWPFGLKMKRTKKGGKKRKKNEHFGSLPSFPTFESSDNLVTENVQNNKDNKQGERNFGSTVTIPRWSGCFVLNCRFLPPPLICSHQPAWSPFSCTVDSSYRFDSDSATKNPQVVSRENRLAQRPLTNSPASAHALFAAFSSHSTPRQS